MRKRSIKKQVWLNKAEATLLKNKSKKSGLSESELIRRLITDSVIKEQPTEDFYIFLKELRAIGNNLNQIARRLNYEGKFNDKLYKEEAEKWNELILKIKKEILTDK